MTVTTLPRYALRWSKSAACRDHHYFQCSGYVGRKRRGETRPVCVCTCHAKDHDHD